MLNIIFAIFYKIEINLKLAVRKTLLRVYWCVAKGSPWGATATLVVAASVVGLTCLPTPAPSFVPSINTYSGTWEGQELSLPAPISSSFRKLREQGSPNLRLLCTGPLTKSMGERTNPCKPRAWAQGQHFIYHPHPSSLKSQCLSSIKYPPKWLPATHLKQELDKLGDFLSPN